MRVAFDTSVLVAGLVEAHVHHERAICWLEAAAAERVEAECSWHAVAETWAVLTRLPIDPPISPAVASIAIERLIQRVAPIDLGGETYLAAIRRCVERGLRSGALFDALHLICAEQTEAEAFVTFNRRDFERLTSSESPPILVPPDPPEVRFPGD